VATVPLFPLPNVVLFPGVLLPLHVFESRYRALVADVLDGDRRLGMVLLRPGWEADYDGRPPIFAIGCAGLIVHAVGLDDGRYNIVVRGLERFRVLDEHHERPYRRATIEAFAEPELDDLERQAVGELRAKLLDSLNLTSDRSGASSAQVERLRGVPDADFVHTLAQYLDLEPIEKQAILERDTVRQRAEALMELLEIKRLQAATPSAAGLPH
jgi:Lon protease-like protein